MPFVYMIYARHTGMPCIPVHANNCDTFLHTYDRTIYLFILHEYYKRLVYVCITEKRYV